MSDTAYLVRLALGIEKAVGAILLEEAQKEHLALSKMQSQFRTLKRSGKEARKKLAQQKKRRPGPILGRAPIIGQRQKQAIRRDQNAAKAVVDQIERKISDKRRDAEARKARIETYKQHLSYLHQRVAFITANGAWFDDQIGHQLRRLERTIKTIRAEDTYQQAGPLIDHLGEIIPMIDKLIHDVDRKKNIVVAQPPVTTPEPDHREKKPTTGPKPRGKSRLRLTAADVRHRIYLPIPIQSRQTAAKLGAQYDENGGRGSRMFVQGGSKAATNHRLQGMLPHLYRDEKQRSFSFPKLPERGYGQNLRNALSDETWSLVRSSLTAATGNRCMICGGRGGKILDSFPKKDQFRRDKVECHEVWEWEVPDEEVPVGIQRLKEILVVCVDCHMMFHEDIALDKVRSAGQDVSMVQEDLRKCMQVVNEWTEDDLEAHLADREQAAEKNAAVDEWIVDLSYLSQQDALKNQVPIVLGEAQSGVSPDMIAGIEFRTEDGELHPAQDAREIYEAAMAELDKSSSLSFA